MQRLVGWLWILVGIGQTISIVRDMPIYLSAPNKVSWIVFFVGLFGRVALAFMTGIAFLILNRACRKNKRV